MAHAQLIHYAPDRRSELRRAIARDQAQLRLAVDGLKAAVRQRTDIRQKIVRQPYSWLAGSFLIGLIYGLRGKS